MRRQYNTTRPGKKDEQVPRIQEEVKGLHVLFARTNKNPCSQTSSRGTSKSVRTNIRSKSLIDLRISINVTFLIGATSTARSGRSPLGKWTRAAGASYC